MSTNETLLRFCPPISARRFMFESQWEKTEMTKRMKSPTKQIKMMFTIYCFYRCEWTKFCKEEPSYIPGLIGLLTKPLAPWWPVLRGAMKLFCVLCAGLPCPTTLRLCDIAGNCTFFLSCCSDGWGTGVLPVDRGTGVSAWIRRVGMLAPLAGPNCLFPPQLGFSPFIVL